MAIHRLQNYYINQLVTNSHTVVIILDKLLLGSMEYYTVNKLFSLVAVLSICVFRPVTANTFEEYIIFNIASYHVNSTYDFDENNFGLSYGISLQPLEHNSWEYGLEVGFYNNSFSEITRYALVKSDIAIGKSSNNTEYRLGVFLGLFEYPSAITFAQKRGILTFGEFILIPGLSATIRSVRGYDLRLNIAPGSKRADAIISIQIGVRY